MLFGRPASVTAFFRAQRGIESDVEDSFTVILQYDGDQKDLLVTVKTCVVTPMAKQLKHLIRGTEGSWVKVSATPLVNLPRCSEVLTFEDTVAAEEYLSSRGADRTGPEAS